jgi:hypothetical protein
MADPGTVQSQLPMGADWVARAITDIQRDIRELGPSIARSFGTTIQTIQAQQVTLTTLVAGLQTQVADAIAANSLTTAQINAKVASPGAIAPTTVTASGAVSGTTGTFPTGISSTGAYGKLLTYGGAYNAAYLHVDGTLGYVPSSRQFKQDIQPVALDPALLRQLRLVNFRYIAAVVNLGDTAQIEVGLIAEEVDALGLHWLVDYDAEGRPLGVKYERLALLLIPAVQSNDDRLTAIEARLATLERRSGTVV